MFIKICNDLYGYVIFIISTFVFVACIISTPISFIWPSVLPDSLYFSGRHYPHISFIFQAVTILPFILFYAITIPRFILFVQAVIISIIILLFMPLLSFNLFQFFRPPLSLKSFYFLLRHYPQLHFIYQAVTIHRFTLFFRPPLFPDSFFSGHHYLLVCFMALAGTIPRLILLFRGHYSQILFIFQVTTIPRFILFVMPSLSPNSYYFSGRHYPQSCKDGSRWLQDNCNWCSCVNGAAICTQKACLEGEFRLFVSEITSIEVYLIALHSKLDSRLH